MTAAAVARAVGCNRSTATRHARNHLLPELREAVAADPDLKHLDVVSELKDLYARMKGHLERAEQSDNWQAIKGFHSEARNDLELLAKLLGELQQEGTVSIYLSPEWLSLRAVVVEALTPYPQARTAVLEALNEPN